MQRLNDLIRDEIAGLLMHQTRDERLHGLISVTGVETAPDLSHCKVFISIFGEDAEVSETLKRMRAAASFFRRELAARLNLRHTPELDFRLDRSIAEGARINLLLKEIEGA
ncbi:MAG: ribosome-binding factor A [Candidatus Handelsmanbacteria bacterium RIFCSPLOWO2_12_FULL_64_10]|uniref:Ribosome-binding factor A n=1 Tax=Handelsmanbacteria sp. (strain RIFCSPLOWO2_12_FULL_64_10) TaxID=1817868 RepID=A0A1F6C5G7_HANXR|nr:MAG: ribosome-binding factor A [Candidatus Handelsmanbacteria bacterium RIFCSPLOWO2_12_FULL_64_10]